MSFKSRNATSHHFTILGILTVWNVSLAPKLSDYALHPVVSKQAIPGSLEDPILTIHAFQHINSKYRRQTDPDGGSDEK